ncbi:MAG TPA: hypothetical protein PLZ40_09030, partial [Ferruginibacter sp.]|nr:hypothetical protein [Ferruginibacter sp.]
SHTHTHTRFFNFRSLVSVFLMAVIFSFWSCKKISVSDAGLSNPEEKIENTSMFSRHNGADEIRQWLEEQKRIIGRDSNRTIDKILSSMMLDRMYRENYEKETFLIVPLERNADLSQNIRRDLNNPLRFLLLVEDTSGRIRKGAVALFYPLENNVSVLPENSFHNYFINQMIRLEGTFSMISLMDIKQYEMDFDNNGNRKEYRLWYGKQTILEPLPQLPVCIDWYLTTTIFFSDGTTYYNEEYLYTQCYENPESGGGGGIYSPASNQPGETFTKQVQNVVVQTIYYEVIFIYTLQGMKFTNSSNNYYSSISGDNGDNGGLGLTGLAIEPSHHNHCFWHQLESTYEMGPYISGVNYYGSKSASARVRGTLTFPNQDNYVQYFDKPISWQASSTF